jgi:NTE family protein
MEEHARKRIGLALGGGVVRGLAHIGVLAVFQEAGIPIDFVAGTSAGSLVGASFCAGLDIEEIWSFAAGMRWWHIARPVLPLQGFVSFEPMEGWIVRELGDITFSDLKIPFTAVATDLNSGEPVILNEGRLAPAVRASCTVPGLVVPLELDGRLLGDGSLSNTVPVSVLRALGADYVIGVDIFSSSIRRRWGPFGLGFAALEILIQRAGGGLSEADCLITPDLAGATYFRFSKKEHLMKQGEKAAREKLDCIRQALADGSTPGRIISSSTIPR